jgi:hypothetical protein
VRRAETQFRAEKTQPYGYMAREWLEWMMSQYPGLHIRHAFNGPEKRVGARRLPVDGWDKQSNTVYQFHGCYWHGHDCPMGKSQGEEARLKRWTRTVLTSSYIRLCGHFLVEVWECVWKQFKNDRHDVRMFAANLDPPVPGGDRFTAHSQRGILHQVRSGRLFGMVECDLHVPPELRDYFSEMQPIFKHAQMTRDHLGPGMQAYAEEMNLLKKPRKCLVGSFFASHILLATPLLNWYLEKGLKVTRVYQVLQYTPVACFRDFGEEVTTARRLGDQGSDPVTADTMKLLGNCGYGKTVTNKDHFTRLTVCTDKQAMNKINGKWFKNLATLDNDLHEVEEHNARIVQDLPQQIGFFVYNYAKLHMLRFYYDLVDKYVDRTKFQYCQMDTDSAYLAISEENLEDAVREEMREAFFREWDQWFPAVACDQHREAWIQHKLARLPEPDLGYPQCCLERQLHDKRTPGLFKLEWVGKGVIALCSKTYLCFQESEQDQKLSTKGVSKRLNVLTKEHFSKALYNQGNVVGLNRGFKRHNDGNIYTYKQTRTALSFFYGKRKVLEDYVTTEPTDM